MQPPDNTGAARGDAEGHRRPDFLFRTSTSSCTIMQHANRFPHRIIDRKARRLWRTIIFVSIRFLIEGQLGT